MHGKVYPRLVAARYAPNEIFHTVLSRGILGLKTNVRNFHWSFGQNPPLASPFDYAECLVRISLTVQPDRAFEELKSACSERKWGKYHYLSGEPSGQSVFYRRPFLLGSELYLAASDLMSQESLIRVNPNYFRCIHYRFMNLHSASFILTDLAALLLLHRQLAPIHCSAFRKDGCTVVVFAPSNTGKTVTSIMACLKRGADFISEDLAITDGRRVFALPWTSTFRYYENVDARRLARFKHRATTALPFLDLIPLVKDKSIMDYLPKERICHSSTATHLVVLERGAPFAGAESREEIFHKITNLNRCEFNYQRSVVSNAYEFFNPELNIAAAYDTERAVLRQLVQHVHQCLVVRTDNPAQYTDLVLQAIS
jgi:hypothetical protein